MPADPSAAPSEAELEAEIAAADPSPAQEREIVGDWILRLGAIVVGAITVVGTFLKFAAGAHLDEATVALVLVSLALLVCMWSLFKMVSALARPSVHNLVERSVGVASASQRELREEKLRVLRAINELQFDHDMGKISADDYKAVRDGYELRAIEVMRELKGDMELHPDLVRDLAKLRGEGDDPAPAAAAKPVGTDDEPAEGEDNRRDWSTTTETVDMDLEPKCDACKKPNDPDAKFCKHCGAKLK